ncbi:MAG TPA: hypothetical protein VG963_21690, partial [Polyangiaceae bacterium]|nr:hypothetical protein [Polyangiaceae bacterium]
MMRVIRLGSALGSLLAGGLLACSGATTTPVASVPAASAAPANAEGRAEPEPDLTPVGAPENLVGIATLRAPAQTLDTLLGWMDVGLDWRALVGSSPAGQFLPILDLDAPIDAVVTLDPKDRNHPHTYSAISVGLSSRASALEVFRSLNFSIEELGRGVQLVHPGPDSTCFVAAALGKAKVRLVCGQDRESVELLTPYLARGNPSGSTGDAALHVEIKAEAAWRSYGDKTQYLKLGVPMLLGELSTGNADFDAALGEATSAGVDEISLLLEDLKDIRLDVRLQNEPAQLSLVLGSDLCGSRSWVARAFTQGEALASVAPESFWKLPLDADQAAYRS